MGDDGASSKDSSSSSEEVPFDFIGRKSAVENAVLMLEYHLDHLKVYNVLQVKLSQKFPFLVGFYILL